MYFYFHYINLCYLNLLHFNSPVHPFHVKHLSINNQNLNETQYNIVKYKTEHVLNRDRLNINLCHNGYYIDNAADKWLYHSPESHF